MFSNIGLDVDEKSCVFEEGRHLGPTLPPPDPVSPHFSPPDRRHHSTTSSSWIYENRTSGHLEATHLKLTQLK